MLAFEIQPCTVHYHLLSFDINPEINMCLLTMHRSCGEWSNDVVNIPNVLVERGKRLQTVNEVDWKEGDGNS